MKQEEIGKLLPFRRVVGTFPSLKTGRAISFYSKLERDLLYHLEFDRNVLSYHSQPGTIEYAFQGVLRTHSPHLLVAKPHRQQLITVKPTRFYQSEDDFARFRAVREVCLRNGYEHHVFTESMICKEPRLTSMKILWRYARTPIPLQSKLEAEDYFRSNEVVTVNELCEHLIHTGTVKGTERQVVYALIFQGVLGIDWEELISLESFLHCLSR